MTFYQAFGSYDAFPATVTLNLDSLLTFETPLPVATLSSTDTIVVSLNNDYSLD